MRKQIFVGRCYEINTIERAIKTEIDTRKEQKGVGKLRWPSG